MCGCIYIPASSSASTSRSVRNSPGEVFCFAACLVSSFSVLFWKINLPSCFRYLALPHVSPVWLSSLIPVFPPVPHFPSCVFIVSLCPVFVTILVRIRHPSLPCIHSLDSKSMRESVPSIRVLLFCYLLIHSHSLASSSFHSLFCFLRKEWSFVLITFHSSSVKGEILVSCNCS